MTIRTAEDMRAAAVGICAALLEREYDAETGDSIYGILDAIRALPVASEWRPFEFKPETTQGWIEFYCQFESMDGNPVAPSIWLANWQDALSCPSKTRQAITHWRPHVAPGGAV